MKCQNCGASIGPSMKNCQYCGSEVDLPSAGSKEIRSKTDSGNVTSSQVQENHALVDFQICPKCQARVPLPSITIAKKAPNILQWILASLFGFFFIIILAVPVPDSELMLLKMILLFLFVDLLVILLWLMFTRRFWVCPACHKEIKIKRNFMQFKQDWYLNMRNVRKWNLFK